MDRKTVIYRGSIKSCNYSCSYCPFSKHRPLKGETEKDRNALERFCESISQRAETDNIGAVMITPYGEAAIHDYYWDAMAYLSRIPHLERVGIQTNLSFSPLSAVRRFERAGGVKDKLSLWATFHPEMTDTSEFSEKCRWLTANGVLVCAGAVGVPENADLIRKLRAELPREVYLWINKMDGLRRNYTTDEVLDFLSVDPFFEYELKFHNSDPSACEGRCFVEADGKIHTCNISRTRSLNWYDDDREDIWSPECIRKNCSCYLAYGGRNDHSILLGNYPVFRQPFRAKAVFCDIEGTITSGRGSGITDRMRAKLKAVSKICPVFFVTSLPYEKAAVLLKDDMKIFSGGACASGGYIFINNGEKVQEKIFPPEGLSGELIRNLSEEHSAAAKIYRYSSEIYKVTLHRGRGAEWTSEETRRVSVSVNGSSRVFTEKNCLQIVSHKADKGNAVRELCALAGIAPEDTVAFGNDTEDFAMERVCGKFVMIEK